MFHHFHAVKITFQYVPGTPSFTRTNVELDEGVSILKYFQHDTTPIFSYFLDNVVVPVPSLPLQRSERGRGRSAAL